MQTFIIGRNPNVSAGEIPVKINDLTNKVSSNHCRITFDGVHYFIEDLISTNGTFVNGTKVSGRVIVVPDSVITLGEKHRFFLSELPLKATSAPYSTAPVNSYKADAKPISIANLIHPKEKTYLTLMYIFGGLFWLVILITLIALFFSPILRYLFFSYLFLLLYLIPVVLILIWRNLMHESKLLQNSIKVTPQQFPDIYEIITTQAQKLQIVNLPQLFVHSSDGIVNAFATRLLHKRYILLLSGITDLMLQRKKYNQLAFIIGHELGHHAAGHFSYFKKLVISPAYIIPFLGAAYHRSREFTADRIGCALIADTEDAQFALVSLACGAVSLTDRASIKQFMQQQDEVFDVIKFFGKIHNLYPSLTRRVEELEKFNF